CFNVILAASTTPGEVENGKSSTAARCAITDALQRVLLGATRGDRIHGRRWRTGCAPAAAGMSGHAADDAPQDDRDGFATQKRERRSEAGLSTRRLAAP